MRPASTPDTRSVTLEDVFGEAAGERREIALGGGGGVGVGVAVGVLVGVFVGVLVGVAVGVSVGVIVGV